MRTVDAVGGTREGAMKSASGLSRRTTVALAGALVLVVTTSPAGAGPGDLDPTFDADGRVTTDFAGDADGAIAVAIQSNGKIVAAGSSGLDFALARYNADASLDPTFDGDGRVTTDFAGDADVAWALALQADGKIVTAGRAMVSGIEDFALARYNTDGSLDPTFDGDGKVTLDFDGRDQAFALALQGDGKIVAAGRAEVSGIEDFALARYNTDGSLDPTFDGDGKVTTDFAGRSDAAFAVAIQENGEIVAAGCASCIGTADDFALARYNTDGSLDPTFDGDGKVITDFARDTDQARAVAIQEDGKIVATGLTVVASPFSSDFALARYNTEGSLDRIFSADGKVTTDFAGDADVARAVAIQGDGKIVAGGNADVAGTHDFALARYKTDGSLDPLFSGDGRVTTDFAGDTDVAWEVALQGDGKIVAAGGARVSGTADLALARYTVCRRSSVRPSSIPCR
jgi:uncharacterized delta-60 repeat protein